MIKVLSLFDGISVGQLALHQLGIEYEYYSSEIDKSAISITQHHFPNTIQLGDIKKIKYENGILYSENGDYVIDFDFIIGGSPCTNLSSAGDRTGLEGSQSSLYYEYIRLIKEVKPKYFFLENVIMSKKYEQIISEDLGTHPILIDSALLSAQTRKRLYWANWEIDSPDDKKIQSTDFIIGIVGSMRGRRLLNGIRKDYDKSIPICQYIECKDYNKSNCLTTVAKDNVIVDKYYAREIVKNVNYRFLTVEEMCWLQTLPIDYVKGLSYNKATKAIGNSWTLEVIKHCFKNNPLIRGNCCGKLSN